MRKGGHKMRFLLLLGVAAAFVYAESEATAKANVVAEVTKKADANGKGHHDPIKMTLDKLRKFIMGNIKQSTILQVAASKIHALQSFNNAFGVDNKYDPNVHDKFIAEFIEEAITESDFVDVIMRKMHVIHRMEIDFSALPKAPVDRKKKLEKKAYKFTKDPSAKNQLDFLSEFVCDNILQSNIVEIVAKNLPIVQKLDFFDGPLQKN